MATIVLTGGRGSLARSLSCLTKGHSCAEKNFLSIAIIIMSTIIITTMADLEDITVEDIIAGIIRRQFYTADILWIKCY